MNTLQRVSSQACTTLVVLVTFSLSPLPAQSPATSAQEVEASLNLDSAQRKRIQNGLRALGFHLGPTDGLFGPRTRKAIGEWQSSQGVPATGYLDARMATTLIEGARPRSRPEAPTIVAVQVTKAISETLRAARSMANVNKRGLALVRIAEAQAKAGDRPAAAKIIAEALRTARNMDARHRAPVLARIAKAQAKAGDRSTTAKIIAEALRAARNMDARHRARVLARIAEAQEKAGDSPAAAKTIAEALRVARSITIARGRASHLGAIARAQAYMGDGAAAAKTAAKALRAARNTNVRSRVWFLLSIAEAQAYAGDGPGRAQTIVEALNAAQSISDVSMRGLALGRVAGAQAEAGDGSTAADTIAEARRAARSIRKKYFRDQALSAIATAQAKSGNIPEALLTARNITWFRDRALSDIAEAQARAGDIAEALLTARGISQIYVRTWPLAALAEAVWGPDPKSPLPSHAPKSPEIAARAATPRTTARADVSSGGKWGAYLRIIGGTNYYGLTWNHPTPDSALDELGRICREKMGYKCLPRHQRDGFWVPDETYVFSSNTHRKRLGDGFYRLRALCVLVYQIPSNGEYRIIRGLNREDVEAKFRREQEDDLKYYDYKYPAIVKKSHACNSL